MINGNIELIAYRGFDELEKKVDEEFFKSTLFLLTDLGRKEVGDIMKEIGYKHNGINHDKPEPRGYKFEIPEKDKTLDILIIPYDLIKMAIGYEFKSTIGLYLYSQHEDDPKIFEVYKENVKNLLDHFKIKKLNSILKNPNKPYLVFTGIIQIRR